MSEHWPFVQRDSEFAALRAAVVGQTDAHGIVVVGEPGVGKTTLIRQVTQSLDRHVHWVAGTESARTIPLGVFAHLVDESAGRNPLAYMAHVRQALLAEANTVLVVDDGHLLDGLSATVLHQLALDGAVRIVATLRTDVPVPDAVMALWKRLPAAPAFGAVHRRAMRWTH